MQLRRTRPRDWLVALAGAAVIGLLFAPWFDGDSGWSVLSAIDVIVTILALVAISVPIITAEQETGAIPVATAVFSVFAGAAATIILAVRLAAPPGHSSLDWGAWAGLAAAVVWTVAGALVMRDERRGQPPPPGLEDIPVLPAPPPGDAEEARA